MKRIHALTFSALLFVTTACTPTSNVGDPDQTPTTEAQHVAPPASDAVTEGALCERVGQGGLDTGGRVMMCAAATTGERPRWWPSPRS